MIEPIIGFTVFFLIVFLIITIGNKSRKKQYNKLLERINGRILFKKEQTECSTKTIGLKNNNYLFRHCDIYITEDSTIIFGYSKNRLIKQLSIPIILTQKTEQSRKNFPDAIIKEANEITIEKNNLIIEFGEKGIAKTQVFIKLKKLTEVEQNKLFALIKKTAANSGYTQV
ncbi:MAG TPA: hypothetical protein VFM65_09345 [Flavobacteriaceae bacterium]|nr:hypothetical protein [Flavobacteriaceae bacterium]